MARRPDRRVLDSGIEVKPLYRAADAPPSEPRAAGQVPVHARAVSGHVPRAARGRSGSTRASPRPRSRTSATATCSRAGQTGLSVAFDLPTQLGYDSDDPVAEGEVGRTGVAIDSIADMELLLDGIPLDEVSTSMTINAPAALLLLLYELVAEEQGVPGSALRGTVQNDILKEYIARGNYIFPPRPSMRLTTDLFAYCEERIPRWNTISISGLPHPRGGLDRRAGARVHARERDRLLRGGRRSRALARRVRRPALVLLQRPQRLLPGGREVPRRADACGRRSCVTASAPTTTQAQALRFHAQTGGSTLTAQQPENNIVRVAVQALSAVCGGAQSLHTNSFDEALALPTEHAATIALRTQQVLMHEAGTTDTADPLGGSYYIEALTAELERAARAS